MPKKSYKDKKNATKSEGESTYDIASRIWDVSDAYDEIYEMQTNRTLTNIERDAGVGAIIARVFALACQATDATVIEAHRKFFFVLGKLRIRPAHFHHAVWKLANWGGLEVEVDNAMEMSPSEQELDMHNIFCYLTREQEKFGCKKLLEWFKAWKYNDGPEQHSHKSGKFDDYTNFLLRWDACYPILTTGPQKLKEHKGDFAAYMEKVMKNKTNKTSIAAIFNPLQGLLEEQQSTYNSQFLQKDPARYGKWACLGKYQKKQCADHGQGIFNPYHSFDQLDHSGIDKAMSSYATGSNMFWGLFILDCLCVIGGEAEKLQARAKSWREDVTTLPIVLRFVELAHQLSYQYAAGSAGPQGKGVPPFRNPYTRDDKKDNLLPDWWNNWDSNLPEWMPSSSAPLTPEEPAVDKNDGAAGEGNIVSPPAAPSYSKTVKDGKATVKTVKDGKATVIVELTHIARLLERVLIDETLCNESSEEDDIVDITTPAFARVVQLRSGHSHAEPDEVIQRTSSRPGIVNCTTPTAFARAEHREPMRNHFYS
jgi:hypothetical protein